MTTSQADSKRRFQRAERSPIAATNNPDARTHALDRRHSSLRVKVEGEERVPGCRSSRPMRREPNQPERQLGNEPMRWRTQGRVRRVPTGVDPIGLTRSSTQ